MKKKITYKINCWLIKRKFLWKKVIFNNGVLGAFYTRYDHILLPYSYGMGNNSKNGDINTVIDWQLYKLQKELF